MSAPSELPSIVTDRYTIEKEIGSGGMATVYLAVDTKHDREVALKVLRPELGLVLGADRFLSEIKITARLDHPHILTLIDSGAADGLLYYVLPYVRGESLRGLLNRETQLSIEDALTLTKQIGSALDYAHRHGVIHRDIKPENILIQEGEAILTDFGIALAVKEAGGNRLTETGLSLGTPQYMSPEQATGDRTLGPKSDQYSLAAVLYEMLTGEPPVHGVNSQAIIAKLLTEEPTHIRTVRKTVPIGVDAAVAKALAKSPADRYATIGDFLRALDSGKSGAIETAEAPPLPARKRKTGMMAAIAVVVIAAIGAGAFAFKGKSAPASAPVALKDRTQLTFSGAVITPSMSSDGKQIAYFVKSCPTEKCTVALTVQDVGSTESRRILEGGTAGYSIEWSPDRRYLLFLGTWNGRYGTYLVSALGGTPRLVVSGPAAFYAGGDSLLVPVFQTVPDNDSTFPVKIAGLTGDVGGRVKVPGGGEGIITIGAIPGSTRFVVSTARGVRALWQVVDRQGNSTGSVMNSCTCGGVASSDAIWMARAGAAVGEGIVRVALDPVTGRIASHQDTVFSGAFTGFSVSPDGTKLVVDDGATDFNYQAMTIADMRARKFAQAPIVKASSQLTAAISPDGNRILKRQSLPDGRGGNQTRLTVIPFGGGAETLIEVEGRVIGNDWVDSVSVGFGTINDKGTKLTVVDIRNGVHRNDYQWPDSALTSASALSNGWVIVTPNGDRIVTIQDGRRSEMKRPSWYQILTGATVSTDHSKIMYWGWNNGTNDSIGYEMVPVAGGNATRVFTTFAERAWGAWLYDGSFVARVWETPEAVTVTKIKGPGQLEKVGTMPHLSYNFSHSADFKRATIGWREARRDAFAYRVVK